MFNTGNNLGYIPRVGDPLTNPTMTESNGIYQETIFNVKPGITTSQAFYSLGTGNTVLNRTYPKIGINLNLNVSNFFMRTRELIGNTTDWAPSVLKFVFTFNVGTATLNQMIGMFDFNEGLGFGFNGTSFGTFVKSGGTSRRASFQITNTGATGTITVVYGSRNSTVNTVSGDPLERTASRIGYAINIPNAEIQAVAQEVLFFSPYVGLSAAINQGTNTTFTSTTLYDNPGVAPTYTWTPLTTPQWFNPTNENAYCIELCNMIGVYKLKALNNITGMYETLYTWNLGPRPFVQQWLPLSIDIDNSVLLGSPSISLGMYQGIVPRFINDSTNGTPGCKASSYTTTAANIVNVQSIVVPVYNNTQLNSPVRILDFKISGVFSGQTLYGMLFLGIGYQGSTAGTLQPMSDLPHYDGLNIYTMPISLWSSGSMIGYASSTDFTQIQPNGSWQIPLNGGINGAGTADTQSILYDNQYIWPGQRMNYVLTNVPATTIQACLNYVKENIY